MLEGRVSRLSRQTVEDALSQVIDTVLQAEIPTASFNAPAGTGATAQLCHVSIMVDHVYLIILAAS